MMKTVSKQGISSSPKRFNDLVATNDSLTNFLLGGELEDKKSNMNFEVVSSSYSSSPQLDPLSNYLDQGDIDPLAEIVNFLEDENQPQSESKGNYEDELLKIIYDTYNDEEKMVDFDHEDDIFSQISNEQSLESQSNSKPKKKKKKKNKEYNDNNDLDCLLSNLSGESHQSYLQNDGESLESLFGLLETEKKEEKRDQVKIKSFFNSLITKKPIVQKTTGEVEREKKII
eukprot:TRINITY_DN7115_c0_g1_i1.p1 TRINITY_DN7115_c0_g1~~TRINITY_DN7115_c0_g1_i1.p1  ORF type:complete len:229 (-),score=74.24 TRINITY_DN7115_c0_g1_i1:584-1270(-)